MKSIIMKCKHFITQPGTRFDYLRKLGFFDSMSDDKYLEKAFKLKLGYNLDLTHPTTFNEKLQWLKLNDRKYEYIKMVDKYDVKQYVADIIGEEFIIPTLGVWERFDDINFDLLPDQLVLKCTHDSGGLAIIRDKKTMNMRQIKKKIEKSMKRNYFYVCREWPYKNVKPRIIAEKYLKEDNQNSLTDYKLYMFNGKFTFLYVSTGLEDHATAKISFLTPEWEFAPFSRADYASFDKLPMKPQNFDKMIILAEKLSKDIPFLRVDFYEVNGCIYFGELTFFPCGGLMPFQPREYDEQVGELLSLPIYDKKKESVDNKRKSKR